jgi:myo-inositol 2-dehydrogenase/D-chiro-inositol 1-dehydrogenase
MSLGIGVIGAGIMGADHARIIAGQIAGAHLAAIADADLARARSVAAETGAKLATSDPLAVIEDSAVAAVLIASPDATHADYTLACLKAGKPVLCEKPLAPKTEDCLTVVEAETKGGKRLVQVGFMRRFDPAYGEMRAALQSNDFGPALMLHCAHRNASAPSFFTSAMSINNSCVHEIDIARWLLAAELKTVRVIKPRASSAAGFDDPLLVVFETDQGQVVDVELYLNCGYGYDIKGELVCETGTISLAPPVNSETRAAGVSSFRFAPDWRPRFAAAYRLQNQAWVNSISSGKPTGASAWDGYVASAVAAAGVRALGSGAAEAIHLEPKPAFYA